MNALRIPLLTILLLAVLASAIGVVWTRHESRVLFVQLTRLQSERDELNVDFGRLELEQATWADPARVDAVARGQLGMVAPTPANTRLLRR